MSSSDSNPISATKAKLIEARMVAEQTARDSLPLPEVVASGEDKSSGDAIRIAYEMGKAADGGSPIRRFDDSAKSVMAEMVSVPPALCFSPFFLTTLFPFISQQSHCPLILLFLLFLAISSSLSQDDAVGSLSNWRASQAANIAALTAEYEDEALTNTASDASVERDMELSSDGVCGATRENAEIMALIEARKNKLPEAPETGVAAIDTSETRLNALRVELECTEMTTTTASAGDAVMSGVLAQNAARMAELERELAEMDSDMLLVAPPTPREKSDIDDLLAKLDALDAKGAKTEEEEEAFVVATPLG